MNELTIECTLNFSATDDMDPLELAYYISTVVKTKMAKFHNKISLTGVQAVRVFDSEGDYIVEAY